MTFNSLADTRYSGDNSHLELWKKYWKVSISSKLASG